MNARIAYVDIVAAGVRSRLCTAYSPHTGYSDECVQEMYTLLSAIRHESKQRSMMFLLGGDFNAEVGQARG